MFTLAGQSVSALELAAFLSGLLSVWLAQRMHIANWPAGILSVSCLALVFWGARLYADAILQLVFVALGLYGWRNWARARAGAVPVKHASAHETVTGLILAALATWAVATLLGRTDSPAPWPDAAILAFSLLAILAQAHRRIECWAAWIAVDLIAIPLYWSRSLPLTTLLYLLFLLLCIGGWLSWEKRIRAPNAAAVK